MRRFLIGAMVLVIGIVMAGTGQAHDGLQRRHAHARFHDQLRLREFERHLIHREAHRQPMTRHQHQRLHDALALERYMDRRGHRELHRSLRPVPRFGGVYGYGPAYGVGPAVGLGPVHPIHRHYYAAPGIGVGSRNFSLWFGY